MTLHKVNTIKRTTVKRVGYPIHTYEVRGQFQNQLWSFTITATFTGDADADDDGCAVDCSYWDIEVHAGRLALLFLAERTEELIWLAEYVSAAGNRDGLEDFEFGLQEDFGVTVERA